MANVGQLEIFNHAQFGEIRTLVDNNGEPWFVAADVCQSLEIKNTTQAIQSLDDDERFMYNIGRQGKANIVNESGLFSLVFQSRKPEAKAFRKWVTSEVLPSIRKHGVYLPCHYVSNRGSLTDTHIAYIVCNRKTKRGREVTENNIVKHVCKELGVTQKELAEELGVSVTTITNWATGKVEIPDMALKCFKLMVIEKKFNHLKKIINEEVDW